MVTPASPTRHLISVRCGILGIFGPLPARALRATLGGAFALLLGPLLALVLAPLHAVSPARAADDIATSPETPPSATSPLRSLTLAEERSLQPARRFKECATCPEMVVIPAGQF